MYFVVVCNFRGFPDNTPNFPGADHDAKMASPFKKAHRATVAMVNGFNDAKVYADRIAHRAQTVHIWCSKTCERTPVKR